MEVLTAFEPERMRDLLDRREYFWLDLVAPDPETVQALGDMLGWHALLVEDTSTFGERPKLDRYGDHALLVFYGATRPPIAAEDAPEAWEPQALETHLHLSARCLVTAHREASPDLAALHVELAALDLDDGRRAVHRILDALTDSLLPLVDATEDELDRLEDEALRDPHRDHLELLAQLRRRVVDLRRIIQPQTHVLRTVRERLPEFPGLPDAGQEYFRDVQDELERVGDRLEVLRDLLASATDVYFSAVSNRLNRTGERLTVVATILLPLTVITGFFGMNFEWLVSHVESFGDFVLYGIGAMVLSVLATYTWVRRRIDAD